MKRLLALLTGIGVAGVFLVALAAPKSKEKSFRAVLGGFQETPAISTSGNGEFTAKLDAAGTTLSFELEYADLTGNPLFAHVHLGQRGVAGGVMFFLCGGGGKPACPPTPATVTGTVVAADVVGPAGQGITAGEFADVLAAMRDGVSYANVHTPMYPSGEIRGQVKDHASER